jgi:hypothetical protein
MSNTAAGGCIRRWRRDVSLVMPSRPSIRRRQGLRSPPAPLTYTTRPPNPGILAVNSGARDARALQPAARAAQVENPTFEFTPTAACAVIVIVFFLNNE